MKNRKVKMHLMYILFLSLIMVGCKSKDKREKVTPEVKSEEVITLDFKTPIKKLDVKISLDTNTIKFGEEIRINLTVKNDRSKTVRFLFANPSKSFGPWATSASLIDIQTNTSMIKLANKAVLHSQVYFEEELEEHYVYLCPGESISGTFDLTTIVSLNDKDQLLSRGSYRLQLFYYSIPTNELEFRII